jgi:putative Mn2+ efflux pump MntP
MNAKPHLLSKMLYGAAAVAVLFTGFGNMPLWKRYYVADLPGLGWSGDFFINVNVHIIAGSLLLAIGAYAVAASLMDRRSNAGRLTRSGTLRAVLLAVAIATGILMVVKNLPGIRFSMAALIILNFTHMAAAVLFTIAALVSLVFRQPWRRIR